MVVLVVDEAADRELRVAVAVVRDSGVCEVVVAVVPVDLRVDPGLEGRDNMHPLADLRRAQAALVRAAVGARHATVTGIVKADRTVVT